MPPLRPNGSFLNHLSSTCSLPLVWRQVLGITFPLLKIFYQLFFLRFTFKPHYCLNVTCLVPFITTWVFLAQHYLPKGSWLITKIILVYVVNLITFFIVLVVMPTMPTMPTSPKFISLYDEEMMSKQMSSNVGLIYFNLPKLWMIMFFKLSKSSNLQLHLQHGWNDLVLIQIVPSFILPHATFSNIHQF